MHFIDGSGDCDDLRELLLHLETLNQDSTGDCFKEHFCKAQAYNIEELFLAVLREFVDIIAIHTRNPP